jgi:hypothetical protein
MKKRKKIIINIVFNMLRTVHHQPRPELHRVLRKNWITYRMEIFMKYTLNSLLNQTNQDFIALVRYEDCTEQLIKDALDKYNPLPPNINFIKNSEIEQQILNNIHGEDYLYIVRIDSDDLYHKMFIQKLHNYNHDEKVKVLINQQGYIYDSINKRLATYSKESPPFYTLVYKTKDYIEGLRHPLPKHKYAIKLPHQVLDGKNFIVNVHSKNTSSKFNKVSGVLINSKEKQKILTNFLGEKLAIT